MGSAFGAEPRHAELVPIPERRAGRKRVTRELAPGARALLVVLGVVTGLVAIYFVARGTPLFALRTIEVRGLSPQVAGEVRRALEPLSGTSLMTLDAGDAERRVARLPIVVSASVDRAFPHTLIVDVRPERPVALLRRGADSWLLSARGRVVRELGSGERSGLPRIWVPKRTAVSVGGTVAGDPASLARALARVREAPLLSRIRTVRTEGGRLTFVLRSGIELRAGAARDLSLKLEVARRVLSVAGAIPGPGYLDVSDPVRPVAKFESQVEG